jgi:DNA-binding transcriptional LysR family regulator
VRGGELDIALVRGIDSAIGLRVRPAWSEPLHVVLPSGHPLGSRSALRVAELAAIPLRFPQREVDPPLHDLVRSMVCATGIRPTLGRPVGGTAETIVEIGGGAPSWTLMPAELLASAGSKQVIGVPLDPPLTVTGSVIAAEAVTDTCLDSFANAFADAAARTR